MSPDERDRLAAAARRIENGAVEGLFEAAKHCFDRASMPLDVR